MNRRLREWLLTAPPLIWLLVFFVFPTLLVFAIAFKPSTIHGGIGEGWTLEIWNGLAQPGYPAMIWRTVWLSVATTVVCLVAAAPVAYWLARQGQRVRNWMLLLIIVPFWTNFLIRIFAWKSLLHSEGFLRQTLVWLGLLSPGTQLLYNAGAVLLVLIYTYLPFAILPLYAAAEKFDFTLLDAARDLGAGRLRAFWKVFIPGIRGGLVTAIVVVFIPALGSYAIPDIVGGPNSEMLGNKIAQKVFVDRNLPAASAMATLLAAAVLLPVIWSLLAQEPKAGKKGGRRHA